MSDHATADDDISRRLWRMQFLVATSASVFIAALFANLPLWQIILWVLVPLPLWLLGYDIVEAAIRQRPAKFWIDEGRRRWWLLPLALASLVGVLRMDVAPSPAPQQPPAETSTRAAVADRPVQPPVIGERSTPLARASRLATQLSGAEWALTSESCATDGIRFSVEGDELIAYPKEVAALHYKLVDGQGQSLTTELGGRTVIFQVHPDGFTHIDEGVERWFRRCA